MTEDHKRKIGLANKSLCGKGNARYWKGKKFSDSHKEKLHKFEKGNIPWNKSGWFKICEICGKEFWVKPHHKDRKYCSHICYWKSRIGKYNGEKHWNWRGGINPINDTIRNSLNYKLWHKSVLERDNFTCQKTGVSGRDIVVHHINNFTDFPELRFAIDNGITLSQKAHRKFHSIYSNKNNTKEQLDEYLNE